LKCERSLHFVQINIFLGDVVFLNFTQNYVTFVVTHVDGVRVAMSLNCDLQWA
jgi:hypothetical protein